MKKLVSWWNTGIILVILGMLVIVNIKSLNYFINSDFAAQIILADVINESHSLLPNEWNFSTEIHISFATLFSIFLLNFFSKWNVCYVISNILTYIVLLFSGYYFCRKLKMKNTWIILTLAMFLAPISYWNLYYYTIGNEYLTYFIYEIIYLSLWLQVKDKYRNRDCFVLAVWSFFLGSMGMRYVLTSLAPAILVEIINFVKKYRKKEVYTVKDYLGLCGTYVSFMLGVCLNKYVLLMHYTVKGHNRYFKSLEEMPNRLSIVLQRIFELFGYTEGALLFSVQGIINILSFLFIMVIVISLIYFWKSLANDDYIRFVTYANVLNIAILVITCEDENYYNDIRGKYFILVLFLCFPVVSIMISKLLEREKILGGGVLIALSIFLAGSSMVSCMKKYNTDSFQYNRQIIDYLIDEDVTNGYASFWNANINVFHSDGKLSISPVKSFTTLELQRHISSSRQYEYTQSSDRYFLWLTEEEKEKYGESIPNVTNSFSAGNCTVYICVR